MALRLHRGLGPNSCRIEDLRRDVPRFSRELQDIKHSLAPPDQWYPWEILANIGHLDSLLSSAHRDLAKLSQGLPVADIGAADGDLAFMLARRGFTVDIVDYGATNWNGLRGARLLADHFSTDVHVFETNLDEQFVLPRSTYGLVFFLGILYHLQNPLYALTHLARRTRHLILSTRIARETTDRSVRFSDIPVAYLVAPFETNNDPTNWWIFSPQGLDRALDRTGWEVLDAMCIGFTSEDSDPSSSERDERAFFLLRSRISDSSSAESE